MAGLSKGPPRPSPPQLMSVIRLPVTRGMPLLNRTSSPKLKLESSAPAAPRQTPFSLSTTPYENSLYNLGICAVEPKSRPNFRK